VKAVQVLRTIYRYWIALLFLAVVVQITFAAYGGFYAAEKFGNLKGSDENKRISEKVFDHGFDLHTAFGYFIFLGAVVLLLLALGARLGKRRTLMSLAVPLLVALQIVLAWISYDTHGVGLLHGLNALVIFGLTGSMAGQAWWGTRRPATAAPPAAPAA
jgi:uncharacterized protein DUF6220